MLVNSASSVLLLEKGRQAIAECRFGDAEVSFTTLANRDDGRAAGMYNLAFVSFLRYVLSDRAEDRDAFVRRSDELHLALRSEPASNWRDLLDAETNLQRAVVWAKEGRYVRAALAGRNAYRTYGALHARAPGFREAYKGYGLLQVAISSLPGTYRKFLAVIGYSGDEQAGYESLRFAAAGDGHAADEASTYLALFDVVLNGSRGDGEERLAALSRKYPSSPLFAHLYGYYLYENRRAREAEEMFRRAVQHGSRASHFYPDYSDYFLAVTLFRQNRFAESVPVFRSYLANHEGPALRAAALLHLGLALEMTGGRSEAVAAYAAVSADRELEAGAVAARRAKLLLERPLTRAEGMLLRGANAYDAGEYDAAKSTLQSVVAEVPPGSILAAEAHYRLGRVNQAVGDTDGALASYARAAEAGTDEVGRWAPWAEYYAGEIHALAGEVDLAEAAYRRALAYDADYDYKQALENNIRLARRRMADGA